MRRNTVEMSPQNELDELMTTFDEQNPTPLDQMSVRAGVDPMTAHHESFAAGTPAQPESRVVEGVVVSSAIDTTPTALSVFGGHGIRPAKPRRAHAHERTFEPAELPKFPQAPDPRKHRPTPPLPKELAPETVPVAPVEVGKIISEKTAEGRDLYRLEADGSKRKLAAGEIIAVKAGKSRRLYQVDKQGRRRQISADAVMSLNGFAGVYQSRDKALLADTAPNASRPVADTSPERGSAEAKASRLARAKRLGKAVLQAPQKTVDTLNALDDRLYDRVDSVTSKVNLGERFDRVNEWGLQKDQAIATRAKRGAQAARNTTETVLTKLDKVDNIPAAAGRKVVERAKSLGKKTAETIMKRRLAIAAGSLAVLSLVSANALSPTEHAEARVSTTSTAPQPGNATNKLSTLDTAAIFEALNNEKMPTKQQPAHETSAQRQSDSVPTPKTHVEKPKKVAPEALKVAQGDRMWDVLTSAGVPQAEIMQRLDAAAKASGLAYEWHGTGKGRWIEVDGKSDTKTIVKALDRYIKR